MKLLFDQNLSYKLIRQLSDLFPDSTQVRLLGMAEATDVAIWRHAETNNFVIVSHDADFAEMATVYGAPPKVIWMRCGNQNNAAIESRLRDHAESIREFAQDDIVACYEIY